MIKVGLIVLLVLANFTCVSQTPEKKFEYRKMTWLGYFSQVRLTDRSGIWTDFHFRLSDEFVNDVHAVLGRVGYVYHLSEKSRVMVGYAFQFQPGKSGSSNVVEQRPWQQIQWADKRSWFAMLQSIRFEQRFFDSGESGFSLTNYRIRQNISFSVPITRKELAAHTPFVSINNEVFINFGKDVVNNYFDQNRFFVGVGYQFTAHLSMQVGYMNIFQQLPAVSQYRHTDAIRLFVFNNFDFRSGRIEK